MSRNQTRPAPQHYAAKIKLICDAALVVEQRILAEGLTIRDMAIVAELMQQKLEVYDEMIDNPPIIQIGEIYV
jgi:hypothetical protein